MWWLRWWYTAAARGRDGWIGTLTHSHIYTHERERPSSQLATVLRSYSFPSFCISLIQRYPHLKASSFYPIIPSLRLILYFHNTKTRNFSLKMYFSKSLIAALAATAMAAPVNVQERQLDAVGGLLDGVTGGGATGSSSDPVGGLLGGVTGGQKRQLDAVGGLLGGVTGTGSAAGSQSSGAAGGSGGLLDPVVSAASPF